MEKPKSALSGSSDHKGRGLRDGEISIRMLQKICWYTKGFHPLKIWQMKTLHDMVMELVQSNLPPDEIERRMTLRTAGGSNLKLIQRTFGSLWSEEWRGREKEVAVLIARNMRESLMGYPGILEYLCVALAEPPGSSSIPPIGAVAHHFGGELSGRECSNSPYCGPA